MAYTTAEANSILDGFVATFNTQVTTINASELDDTSKTAQISALRETLKVDIRTTINGTPFGFTAQMSRDDIVSLAINDIAYRYALQALNPFTLFGPDYETRHNQDGALTLAIDGTDVSLYTHQIAFGAKHNDTIHGAAGNDHLYGMTGNDLINGAAGNDPHWQLVA